MLEASRFERPRWPEPTAQERLRDLQRSLSSLRSRRKGRGPYRACLAQIQDQLLHAGLSEGEVTAILELVQTDGWYEILDETDEALVLEIGSDSGQGMLAGYRIVARD